MRGVRNLGEIQGSNFSSIAGFGLRAVWDVSWIFGGAVSFGKVAHGFTGFGEEVVVFGSAFFGAGFGAIGAFGDGV